MWRRRFRLRFPTVEALFQQPARPGHGGGNRMGDSLRSQPGKSDKHRRHRNRKTGQKCRGKCIRSGQERRRPVLCVDMDLVSTGPNEPHFQRPRFEEFSGAAQHSGGAVRRRCDFNGDIGGAFDDLVRLNSGEVSVQDDSGVGTSQYQWLATKNEGSIGSAGATDRVGSQVDAEIDHQIGGCDLMLRTWQTRFDQFSVLNLIAAIVSVRKREDIFESDESLGSHVFMIVPSTPEQPGNRGPRGVA